MNKTEPKICCWCRTPIHGTDVIWIKKHPQYIEMTYLHDVCLAQLWAVAIAKKQQLQSDKQFAEHLQHIREYHQKENELTLSAENTKEKKTP